MANDGPQPVDVNAVMQQAAAVRGAGSGGSDADRDILETTLGNSSRLLRRFLGVHWESLFNTGIFKQFDSKGALEGPINKGAAAFNVKGGAATNFISSSLQLNTGRDFSKLTKPAIEGFPVLDMPITALGDLRPSDGGGGIGGRYLG